jgi:hypothetical protein
MCLFGSEVPRTWHVGSPGNVMLNTFWATSWKSLRYQIYDLIWHSFSACKAAKWLQKHVSRSISESEQLQVNTSCRRACVETNVGLLCFFGFPYQQGASKINANICKWWFVANSTTGQRWFFRGVANDFPFSSYKVPYLLDWAPPPIERRPRISAAFEINFF